MIPEHKQAILTADLPEYDLKAGDISVIVHIYPDGHAYEIELLQ